MRSQLQCKPENRKISFLYRWKIVNELNVMQLGSVAVVMQLQCLSKQADVSPRAAVGPWLDSRRCVVAAVEHKLAPGLDKLARHTNSKCNGPQRCKWSPPNTVSVASRVATSVVRAATT